MRRWMKALLAVVLVLTMFGCGEEEEVADFKAIQDAGVLKIGVTVCPPFVEIDDDGNWTGFDIDLAEAVAQALGVEPSFVKLQWNDRWTALNEGTVDCVWSCVTATDDLVFQVDLSQTYLASAPVLVTLADHAEETDFTGFKIIAEYDSACALAAEACLGQVELIHAADQQEAIDMLLAREAEGAVIDQIVAGHLTAGALTVRSDLEMGVQELAVATRLNSDLTDEINKALTALQSQGILDTLAERYQIVDFLVVG